MQRLVGKGFNGAANMSGHLLGVSARLAELYPNAKYLNHALNLVMLASCNKVPDIRYFMYAFKELTLLFKYSAKCKHILLEHLKNDKDSDNLLADSVHEDDELIPNKHNRGLPVLSDTCWLTRVDSINCLLKQYKALYVALEVVRNCSVGHSASDAEAFLKRLQSLEFLMSAIICHHVLAFTK